MEEEIAIPSTYLIAFGTIGGGFILMRLFASKVYDFLICSMTRKWYAEVLSRLEKNERVLDIGIDRFREHNGSLHRLHHVIIAMNPGFHVGR